MEKSSIHFAKGVSATIRGEIMDELSVRNMSLSEKYLGMPSDVGASTNGAFKYLKDRVWKRVQGWMEQSLSAGGKEVLIKAVAQAIPTYSMSCFRLPRGLCEHINGVLRRFWWGQQRWPEKDVLGCLGRHDKAQVLGWYGLPRHRTFQSGALGSSSMESTEPESLSARILKSVYYPNGEFLEATLGARPSKIWRIDGKDVLAQGIIRRIGTGESTKIWSTNWLPRDGLLRLLSPAAADPPQLVSELIDPTTASWDRQKVTRFFNSIDAEVICSIPLSTRRQDDVWA